MKSESGKAGLLNPANLVTFSRIVLLFLLVLVLPGKTIWIKWFAVLSVPLLILLDGLDGFLARRYDCATRLGSLLDIAGDRIVEVALWMILALSGTVPLWVVFVVLVRGFLTDAFRSQAINGGGTPFSIVRSKIAWWFVASPASRTTYALFKAVLFTCGMAIWLLNFSSPLFGQFFAFLVILTLTFSLLRALFSIKESIRYL